VRIVPITLKKANSYVKLWHRHCKPTNRNGGKFAIALEHVGEIIGVAIVGRPTARLLQHGNQPFPGELLRLAVAPDAPKGSGSKLYSRAKRIWQLMGGTVLHTYTLDRESGATMRAVGFRDDDAVRVKPGQANRPSRPRDHQDVYDEPKLRWDDILPEIPA